MTQGLFPFVRTPKHRELLGHWDLQGVLGAHPLHMPWHYSPREIFPGKRALCSEIDFWQTLVGHY